MNIILKPKGALLLVFVLGILCYTAFAHQKRTPIAVATAMAGVAPERRTYPVDGLSVLGDDPTQWMVAYDNGNNSSLTLSDKPNANSKKGKIIAEFKERQEKDTTRLQRVLLETLYKGDHIVLTFEARVQQKGHLRAVLFAGGNTELALPTSKSDTDLFEQVELTTYWKKYTIAFDCRRDYRANNARLQLQPDRFAGTYEVAAITLTDFGSGGSTSESKSEKQ